MLFSTVKSLSVLRITYFLVAGYSSIKLDYATLQRNWVFRSLKGTSFFLPILPLQLLFGNNYLDLNSTAGKKAVCLLLCLLMVLTNSFFFNVCYEKNLITSSNSNIKLPVFSSILIPFLGHHFQSVCLVGCLH